MQELAYIKAALSKEVNIAKRR